MELWSKRGIIQTIPANAESSFWLLALLTGFSAVRLTITPQRGGPWYDLLAYFELTCNTCRVW